jgi:hypothetical protein
MKLLPCRRSQSQHTKDPEWVAKKSIYTEPFLDTHFVQLSNQLLGRLNKSLIRGFKMKLFRRPPNQPSLAE